MASNLPINGGLLEACTAAFDAKSAVRFLMIGIDYESFIIISTIGAHYLKHNTKQGSNWDSVWENTRQKKIEEVYSKKKLTIFAVSHILNIPKERRHIRFGGLKHLMESNGMIC